MTWAVLMASSSLPDLLSWLRSVGIWLDEQLVEIRAGSSGCSGPDLGVFAVSDITENQVGTKQWPPLPGSMFERGWKCNILLPLCCHTLSS
jgi:hypothetical protein